MGADRRVLIVGAGIGGLAAAHALHRAGLRPHVFERGSEVSALGGAVTLHVAARRALAELGMSEPLTAVAGDVRNHTFVLKSANGRVLLTRRADAVTIARRELVRALADRLPEGTLELDAPLVDLRASQAGITARFGAARDERGAVLVGADGIHSLVRRQTVGATPLRYSGFTAWRAIATFTHSELRAGVAQFAVGRGERFGMIPMSAQRVDWFAWRAVPEAADADSRPKDRLAERFAAWFPPIPELIQATPEHEILTGRIYDRPPTDRWGSGRVTLLGDAAHAALPSSGQGAGLAVEDALVLADELSRVDLADRSAVAAALRAYEARRIPPTSAVVRRAWRETRAWRWRNPALCWFRDTRLRAAGLSARARRGREPG